MRVGDRTLSGQFCEFRVFEVRLNSLDFGDSIDRMTPPPPGPYSGKSTLALALRVSGFSIGVLYGSIKLKYLKAKKSSAEKDATESGHH